MHLHVSIFNQMEQKEDILREKGHLGFYDLNETMNAM